MASNLSSKIPSAVPKDLLESNDPAIESHIPAIHDFLARARDEKSRFDAKIEELKSNLEELCSERDALVTRIRRHEGMLSPLRRIPPEILSLIFSDTFCRHPDWGPRTTAPWIASEVCARWRDLAVRSPTLWTTINNRDPHLNSPRLRAQLDRSRDLPLRINFLCKTMNDVTDYEVEMVGAIVQHCARWEAILFTGPASLYSHLRDFAPQFPMLRTLWLEMDSVQTLAHSTLDMFSSAPRLEVATVQFEQWRSPIALDLPWHQLLGYRVATEWTRLSVLASAVNLIECTLHMGDDLEPDALNIGVVLVPCLLRLSITDHGVLKYLETPALIELYDYDQQPVAEPTVFRRVPRTLQKLVLQSNLQSLGSHLARILEGLPRLKCFGDVGHVPLHLAVPFLAVFAQMSALEELGLGLLILHNGPTVDDLIDAMEAVDWKDRRLRSFRFRVDLLQEEEDRMRLLCARQRLDIQITSSYIDLQDALVPETLQI